MAKPELIELLQLQTELARLQERFGALEIAAEKCTDCVTEATKLATKLEIGGIAEPELRAHAEKLQKAAQHLKELKVFEELRTQLTTLRKPLQQLEALGIRRE